MRPKIKIGYPVTVHDPKTADRHTTKVGIVCQTQDYETTNRLDVVYVDAAFKAWRGTATWTGEHFEWIPDQPSISAEDDPTLEAFVITVKNGRY